MKTTVTVISVVTVHKQYHRSSKMSTVDFLQLLRVDEVSRSIALMLSSVTVAIAADGSRSSRQSAVRSGSSSSPVAEVVAEVVAITAA